MIMILAMFQKYQLVWKNSPCLISVSLLHISVSEILVSMEVPTRPHKFAHFACVRFQKYQLVWKCTISPLYIQGMVQRFRNTSQYGSPRKDRAQNAFLSQFQKYQLVWKSNIPTIITTRAIKVSEILVSMEVIVIYYKKNKNMSFRNTSQYGSFFWIKFMPDSISFVSEILVSMEVKNYCLTIFSFVKSFRNTSQYGRITLASAIVVAVEAHLFQKYQLVWNYLLSISPLTQPAPYSI